MSIICPPRPVYVHKPQVQTLDINLMANFMRPPFTVTSIWVEQSRLSYFQFVVPNMTLDGRPHPLLKLNSLQSLKPYKASLLSRDG